MLTTYVSTAENGFNLATPELRHVFATHVQDLVALVLGAMRDSAKLACGRGLRAARLAAIKAEVTANLSRLDLSSDVVAASQGISASYLRKLFAVEGMSFVDFVLEQRLLRAHRMLADPRFAERAISAVAFEVGFNDCRISTAPSAAASGKRLRTYASGRRNNGPLSMAATASDFSTFRFSTDDLPERDRMAIWHDVFGRQIVKVQFEALPETRFFHATTFRRMPGLLAGLRRMFWLPLGTNPAAHRRRRRRRSRFHNQHR